MPEDIVVIGAGGFGRETLDVIEAAASAGDDLRLLGVVDAGPREEDLQRLAARGIPYLGSDEWWESAPSAVRYLIGIGDPGIRARVAGRLTSSGFRARSVVHPRAVVGSQAVIGDGVVIASGVQVSTNVMLGDHVHLNPGAIIGHDTILRDFVSVNPGAIVSGNVSVEPGVLLGAGSVVLQGLTIGAGAVIGASACVTTNVPTTTTVVGVPARKMENR